MNRIRSNRGTSLVEVLVVMVILLVGIMSVVRVFPWGFESIRSAENLTFARGLAQFELERWKNNAENLPDGIIPIDTNGNILDDRYPGPPVLDEAGKDNATTFRHIIGETTRIPFGGTGGVTPMGGSRYMLSFAPIVDPDHGGMLAIRGGNLTRRLLDPDDSQNVPAWKDLKAYQYAIDYDTHQICFPEASSTRAYYLSISWWENSSNGQVLRSATDIYIEVKPTDIDKWLDIEKLKLPDGSTIGSANFINLESYSDTVCRGFLSVTSFSSDPYEYQIVNPVMGIVLFNPLGYEQKEFGKCLEARIDYDILDLQIIHEDKQAPTQATGTVGSTTTSMYRVRLTLPRIKRMDGEYVGFPVDPAQPNVDFWAIDLETTLPIDLSDVDINYKDGTADFPESVHLIGAPDPVKVAGRNIRFFYKAEGDWSVQLLKAYSQYERANSVKGLSYNTYAMDDSKPDEMWFSACNGNHMIAVDYEYDDGTTTRKVVGETHKTSDIPDTYMGKKCTYLHLSHTPTTIYAVRGISVKSRVIWREGDIWRNVDLDEILTRKSVN